MNQHQIMTQIKWIIIFTFLSVFAKAQDFGKVEKGISLAFQNDGSMYEKGISYPTKLQLGGHAGFMLKIPFDYHVFFVPQADLNFRQFQQKKPVPNEYFSISEWQLRLAPMLQIDFSKAEMNTFFLQFGPSFGYGLKGKQTSINNSGIEESRSLKYGYQAYGRYDVSAHAIFGYETTSGLRLAAEYVYGLGNMINTEMAARLKYRTIAIEFGYLLGRKSKK